MGSLDGPELIVSPPVARARFLRPCVSFPVPTLAPRLIWVCWCGGSSRGVEHVAISAGCRLYTADIERLADRHIGRSEEHTSELQSRQYLVCRLLLEKKK